MLTKNDIHAIRKANDICIHLNPRHPNGLVRLIKRKPYNPKPFDQDQEHVLTATVELSHSRRDEVSAECFAMAGIYRDQNCGVSSILMTLRAGDEITFSFYPDAHSNQYVAKAGLHADALFLHVRRNGKRIASFEFETSVCPNNSARMCRGIPESDEYRKAASAA
jgi:hypothetical protein